MAKLSKQDKIDIYNKRQQGASISELADQFGINRTGVHYLISLIDYHGIQILEKPKKSYYSKELKEKIINDVLLGKELIEPLAIKYGLPSDGMIHSWIKQYKANGGIIVEKPKGRSKSMKKRLNHMIK